jgi:hypothetical protein
MTKVGKIESDKSWLFILSEQEQIDLILEHPPFISLVDEEMREKAYYTAIEDETKVALILQDESLLQYAEDDEDIKEMY